MDFNRESYAPNNYRYRVNMSPFLIKEGNIYNVGCKKRPCRNMYGQEMSQIYFIAQ